MTYGISTHTLTWSVTGLKINNGSGTFISTHTLTWSVTDFFIFCHIILNISTHTLTWSVTRRIATIVKALQFQLTRSRGA